MVRCMKYDLLQVSVCAVRRFTAEFAEVSFFCFSLIPLKKRDLQDNEKQKEIAIYKLE